MEACSARGRVPVCILAGPAGVRATHLASSAAPSSAAATSAASAADAISEASAASNAAPAAAAAAACAGASVRSSVRTTRKASLIVVESTWARRGSSARRKSGTAYVTDCTK